MNNCYRGIREQLLIEVNVKHYGMVDSMLSEIERKEKIDDFCEHYVKYQNLGHHPFECLITYSEKINN